LDTIKISFIEDGKEVIVKKGENLLPFVKRYQKFHSSKIVAARFNNFIVELFRPLDINGKVRFIDLSEQDGVRIYQRGLLFILKIAIKKKFPDLKLHVLHSLGKGLYCEVSKDGKTIKLTEDEIKDLEKEMRSIVEKDEKFEKITLYKYQAFEIFKKEGMEEKINLFRYRKKKTIKLYKCEGFYDYLYGYMPPSTGYVDIFALRPYDQGFVLVHPDTTCPDRLPAYKELPKFSAIFLEYARWLKIMDIEYVYDLNEIITKGERAVASLILLAESLHENKISQIANDIARRKGTRLVLIAGPSSSGKTTFAKRLSVQLMVNGLRPVAISLDDYFLDREKTPRDESGNYDFDSLEALDVDLFNRNLLDLFKGKEVEIPRYDFKIGKRMKGRRLRIDKDQIVIVEGIHGLNEKLTEMIPRELKYKIYVSALTQLNLDNLNRIPTTDTRLIRRIVRDNKFRGYSAYETIKMWPNVRRGEERNIFPYQEEADVMFNSALVYELSVLKIFAEPLLVQVPDNAPEFTEALRLLKLLEYFLPITNIEDIPSHSILREFIGRSIFKY